MTGAAASVTPRAWHLLADTAADLAAGGKAQSLARLIALGVPVPPGTVIPSGVFERWIQQRGIGPAIEALTASTNASDPQALRATASAIRELVMDARFTPEVDALVGEIGAEWLDGPVVVRSSAVGEDGADASFAGQLDSILHVTTSEALAAALRTCWASYWSERALFYRAARGVRLAGMGVIVQRQVPASVAGVLFTRAPYPSPVGAGDDLVVEYCSGLADRLVSGEIDPGRLRIRRSDLTIAHEQAFSHERPPNDELQLLTSERVRMLAHLALGIERDAGAAQDIEWAIDGDGAIWILQARPITTSIQPMATPIDSTQAVLWSNANVNENFPEPICPLLYSIASTGYYHYFRNLGLAFGVSKRRLEAMDGALRGIIGVHGARMYYNLTNIHATLRMAPMGDRLTSAFNTFVGASETAAQPAGATGWGARRRRAAQALELARIAMHTSWQYAFLGRRVAAFERGADEFARQTSRERLQRRTLAELAADLHGFIHIRQHRWKNASLADAAAMVTYALLRRVLERAGAAPGTHNRLLRAIPNVPSTQPPIRLWELARVVQATPGLAEVLATLPAADVLDALETDPRFEAFRAEFERYLEDWGFRSSSELMLTVPSLQERPEPVIDLLRQYVKGGGESPVEIIQRQAAERRTETRRLLGRLLRSPLLGLATWRLIGWTQRSVCYRERARLKQALLYSRCRQIALAIGDRLTAGGILADRNDVFMLTRQEIDELASGRAMFPYHVRDLVSRRRHEFAELSAMTPPDDFRLCEGGYLDQVAGHMEGGALAPPCEPGLKTRPPFRKDAPAPSTLAGTSACGGRVRGRAAVLADVSEANRLTHGDVLVTRQTDPGWGPVFCLISGLVIERGGMLSHGAIIAREFGLPCVVGVAGATRHIGHGQTITVDGDRGTCELEAGS